MGGQVSRTHPAILAGTASINAVDGSTAVPPGTYTPTAPDGVGKRGEGAQQCQQEAAWHHM